MLIFIFSSPQPGIILCCHSHQPSKQNRNQFQSCPKIRKLDSLFTLPTSSWGRSWELDGFSQSHYTVPERERGYGWKMQWTFSRCILLLSWRFHGETMARSSSSAILLVSLSISLETLNNIASRMPHIEF